LAWPKAAGQSPFTACAPQPRPKLIALTAWRPHRHCADQQPPPTDRASPTHAPAHGFRTVRIPCATSIVEANFTFAFSSSHFALLPPCSSPAAPPVRATRKHHLPVAKLAAPSSYCCVTRARLAAPFACPCEPKLGRCVERSRCAPTHLREPHLHAVSQARLR
jgi:hypothetical protein